jgi:predicted Zn-dependent protease
MINAQSYKKILSKYDIIELLPEKSDGDATSFWTFILDENKELVSSLESLLTKGGSAKDAREKMRIALSENSRLIDYDAIFNAHLDSMKYIILGRYGLVDQTAIYYLQYKDINAFCTPKINGPMINVYVCEGLLKALPEDSEIGLPCFYAVLAHEFTHGLFNHALFHLYKTIKKEKSNNLFADIATGMAVFNDSYSKARGIESQIKDVGKYNKDVHEWAERNALLYQFKYGREQEYQADIVAFRLLDWLGIGGEAAITMLESIESPFEFSDEYNDHPTTQERIELLKFMSNQKRVKFEWHH